MKHPFRFWMTGSVAVVMAAFGMGRAVANERQSPSQSSRFCVMETLERIEACAQKRGLSVFTRLIPGAQHFGEREDLTLLVFESSGGGTPVLMESAGAQPELPLAIAVRADSSGGAEVIFTSSDWSNLPDRIARDVTELPLMVADALR